MKIERGHYGPLPYAAVGAGPPLVVLAGLMPTAGVGSDWIIHTALSGFGLLRRERRLIVLNRRPGLPAGMTLRDMADEHSAALQELQDTPVDVVGTSTGGSLAQQLAADHPQRVDRLVLVSTACRLDPRLRQAQAQVGQALRAGRRDRAAAAAVDATLPPWCARPVVRVAASAAGTRMIPSEQDAADLATTIEAEDGFDLRDCPAVAAPTLLVAGSRDRLYSAAMFAETARLIPCCELHVIPARGHATVLLGRRGPALITAFLDKPSGARRS